MDFWKFIASIWIALVHSKSFFGNHLTICKYGGLAVEFFFVTGGFLMAASVYRDQREYNAQTIGSETWKYMWNKFKGFGYYYVIGYLINAAIIILHAGIRMSTLKTYSTSLFEFLLLEGTGIPHKAIFAPAWYLSAMMMTEFAFYPLFRRNKDAFSGIIAPVLSVAIIGSLGLLTGTLGKRTITMGIFPKTLFVAVAETALGIVAYRFSVLLKQRVLSKAMKVFLSVADLLLIVGSFAAMWSTETDTFLLVFAIFLFVIISGSRQAYITECYPPKVCRFLGKLSLAIFMMHYAVRRVIQLYIRKIDPVFRKMCKAKTTKDLFCIGTGYILVTIVAAVLLVIVGDYVKKRLEKKKDNTSEKIQKNEQ